MHMFMGNGRGKITSIKNETEMHLNQQSGNVIDAVSVRLYSVTPLQG